MTGRLSRAGYYRWQRPPVFSTVEMELRDHVQQVALEWPSYGYRRITAELRRRGFDVNQKRVLRMMRADNLLCLRRRAFVVTTDSQHALPMYQNLAREIRPNGVNQLWLADVTYIVSV
jgi:transposase InsO family protein